MAAPGAVAMEYDDGKILTFYGYEKGAEQVAFIPQKYPDELYDKIYNGLIACDQTIDISEFNVMAEDIGWVYSSLFLNNPELFYLDNVFGYAGYPNGVVAFIEPTYKYTGEQLEYVVNDYNDRLDEIVSKFDMLNNIEAVVAVNDYLAIHYEYDLYNAEVNPQAVIRDAYGMMVNKRGVCQGYALLFIAIMNRLGVECASVVSNSMNHQWNVVKLGEYWYHIDVTWDDPTGVQEGFAYHNYMLQSDKSMNERLGHYDWVRVDNSTETCYDTKYDDWTWTETNTQLTPHNGKWYYAINNADSIEIIEISDDGSRRVVHSQQERWDVWGEPGYAYTSGFATSTWNKNWMLYHSQNKLYCYDTELDKVFFLTELDTSLGYVYFVHIDGDQFEYIVSTSPVDFSNATHLSIDMNDFHYSSDVNADGITSSADFNLLRLNMLGYASDIHYSDVNCDGVADSSDLLRLQQIALGISKPSVVYNFS